MNELTVQQAEEINPPVPPETSTTIHLIYTRGVVNITWCQMIDRPSEIFEGVFPAVPEGHLMAHSVAEANCKKCLDERNRCEAETQKSIETLQRLGIPATRVSIDGAYQKGNSP